MSDSGKRALVTGASGAIGSAICRRLAAAGYRVIVHANTRVDRARSLVDELVAQGACAESLRFDVTDAAETRSALEDAITDGPIQIVVSNAGIHDDAPMAGMRAEQWTSVIDVSLHGFFNVCQPLLLPMIRTRWGRIVAVSSVAGQLGNRGQVNYAAAKSALHGATRSLSRELASRGITANAVAPGIVAGEMADKVFDRDTIRSLVPARRAGRPDEVAALIEFLATDDAAYITGQVIGVNGGMA